jgi:hypothetical protein
VSSARISPRFLQWFGVFGAAFAWASLHVAGFALTLAHCDRAGSRWQIATDGLTIAMTALAAAIALLAGASALVTYRAAGGAGHDDPPPGGRMQFLGVVGMAVTPLFLFIILMDGSGVLAGPLCRQS